MKSKAALFAVVLLLSLWPWDAAAQVAVKLGRWRLLVQNGGVSAMHMTTTHLNTVVMFDRTNFGSSQILLDNGHCRDNPQDQVSTHDCTAHSIEYNVAANNVRPLMIFTDTWCSSDALRQMERWYKPAGIATGHGISVTSSPARTAAATGTISRGRSLPPIGGMPPTKSCRTTALSWSAAPECFTTNLSPRAPAKEFSTCRVYLRPEPVPK
ncbi:hypothetical protein SUGI_0715420 [Cryptomeria japonica]|nr:hypothetical protein SUGI_0715420 [Cryptomeria japonica]